MDFAGASRMQFYKGCKAEFIAILRWYSLSAYPMLVLGETSNRRMAHDHLSIQKGVIEKGLVTWI